MSWEQIKGGWKRMISLFKGNWDDLTEEELTFISEKREQLIGFLQESYGCEKEQAEEELEKFTGRLAAARSHGGNGAGTIRAGSECHAVRRSAVSEPQRGQQKYVFRDPGPASRGNWRSGLRSLGERN